MSYDEIAENPNNKEIIQDLGISKKIFSKKFSKVNYSEMLGINNHEDDVAFLDRIFIGKYIYETSYYCQKFGCKNCFIMHENKFCEIIAICDMKTEIGGTYFVCKSFDFERLSKNTVMLGDVIGTIRVEHYSNIKKLIPIFCNNKIYVATRPNDCLNE